MAHVSMQHVAFNLTVGCNVEHGLGDIQAKPHVAALTEDIAGDARTAADIQQELLLVARDGKNLKRSLRQLRLNVNHTGVDRILLSLRLVVKNVGRGHLLGPLSCHVTLLMSFI